jgi:CrcB protein
MANTARITQAAIVFFFGGAGALSRLTLMGYFESNPVARGGSLWNQLPLPTLTVNALGCLAAGVVAALIQEFSRKLGDHNTLLLTRMLLTGFLGGFTTFSAFSVETLQLFRSGALLTGGLYLVLSTALLPLVSAAGFFLAQMAFGTKRPLGF